MTLQSDAAERYLDLMKQCLTRYLFIDEEVRPLEYVGWRRALYDPLRRVLADRGMVVGRVGGDRTDREVGRGRPNHAETMAGLARLDNVQHCVTDVVRQGVPGDLIETGVWRGGTSILMRAVLAALGDRERRVWVADSFQGLPTPDELRYPPDGDLEVDLDLPWLKVSLDEVRANFARYKLLDQQVSFLEGWFKDTLPEAPIERLAVMRLDGDMYESTTDALTALYPKLSVGGYAIVDDYGCFAACREAVHDYREAHGITEEIVKIDWTGVYWKKLS